MKKRVEKSENGVAQKKEIGGLFVGKRGGFSTPVIPWRKSLLGLHDSSSSSSFVSARKLAAALWEFHQCFPSSEMYRGYSNGDGGGGGGGDSRLRRHLHKDKGFQLSNFLADPCPSSPEQPASASSLRRHVAASLMQHHRSIEKNSRALQPVSPASYGSSMEVTPYNPAATPSSSLDFKGRVGESNYRLQTSTELLKVLNRIWSLEEQHTSNVSLIKVLKAELEHARGRIKELLRDQQADRHELDELMKQVAEDKLVRKSKEQDRIHTAIQSVRDELENERKLRKRSESLHRKLARELSEVKHSLSNALKELERDRNSRKLLEDLCDEFAKGIKDYEQVVRALKLKSDKDWADVADQDGLILHISESWLDERMQMNVEAAQHGFAGKNSIVDKLSSEIETFLQAKKMNATKSFGNVFPRDRRRNSLESVPLNEVGSAPQDVGDGEDSAESDSNCFELNKPSNNEFESHENEIPDSHIDETVESNHTNKNFSSRDKVNGSAPSGLQLKFEEQMAWAMSCNGNKKKSPHVESEQVKAKEGNPIEMGISQKSENCEVAENGNHERKKHEEKHRSHSNHTIDNKIRSQSSLPESRNIHLRDDCGEASCSNSSWRNRASPVRQWMAKLTTQDQDVSESSSKLPHGLKENSLKAKLLEARSKGQRSRLKFFKGSS